MYLEYFGLTRLPFSIAPDPDLLYLSPAHNEALAHLNYALTGHGGLMCLTGEVGMGKTTLCRAFIDQAPEFVDIAYIFNPALSATELLQAICQELEIACVDNNKQLLQSNKQLFDVLYQALITRYAEGKKVICIIDEAQSMPAPLLEQIRLLTNLETNKDKLLTLILVGQPELQQTLAMHGIRQLDQRITARFHLSSMEKKQLGPYLKHRLRQAGCEQTLFDRSAENTIWQAAKGIPRLINSIADRALLGAYATSTKIVNKKIAQQAATEVLGKSHRASSVKQINQSGLWSGDGYKTAFNYSVKSIMLLCLVGLVLTLASIHWPWASLFSIATDKNHYQLLAEANGLSSKKVELASCDAIQSQTSWQCLSLDWSLADLKRLQRSIAVYDGVSWQVTFAQQLSIKPLSNVILWQPMAAYGDGLNKPIKPGASHPLIVWARERIASLENINQQNVGVDESYGDWQVIAPVGQESLGFNEYYDPLLARKIGNFQTRSGLEADRIIGLKTLLALQIASQDPAQEIN